MDDLSLCALGPILIDWLALVDGYCYVGRQRSWTWIKLDSARSAVPGSTRSANASVAHAYLYISDAPVRREERREGSDKGAGDSGPILLQDSECSFASDLIWSSRRRRALDSELRVRELAAERGICPSNLVREIVSSGRPPPPTRTAGMGLFRGKAPAE